MAIRRTLSSCIAVGALLIAAPSCHDTASDAQRDAVTGGDAGRSDMAAPDTVNVLDGEAPPAPIDILAEDLSTEVSPTDSGDTGEGPCDGVGCRCATNSDCVEGFCIEGLDGGVCTRTCISECPVGFDCLLSTAYGTDPLSICVPVHTRLCRPCREHAECQSANDPFPAYCVPGTEPGAGSFCASSCASRGCPDGYSCEDVALAEGGNARQCVPTNVACECRPSWAAYGFSTDCEVTNAFGTCGGTRSCLATGLSVCEGPLASSEVCDGADNDCNGQVDDIPALPCAIPNAFGTCAGITVCDADGGEPVCSGREASTEICNGIDDDCDTQRDESGCDDSLICTTDTCVGGASCNYALQVGYCLINGGCWAAGQFNPQNACQLCASGENTSGWTQAPNTCVVGGQCYPNGAVNPANGCQVCNANQSSTTWTTSSNTCTIGGRCYLANESNPSNPCEICVPFSSTTAWTQASNTCNIQGQCYAAGVARPGLPCQVCDPSRSATGWSPALAGTACNDGNPCSRIDTCDGAGVCGGDTSCSDGVACTKDLCTSNGCDNSQIEDNWCRINGTCHTQGFTNPSNQCQACLPTASQATRTVWSNKATTEACNDGNACTLNDTCSGTGLCRAGALKNCSDGLSCTADSCDPGTGLCSSGLQTGNCLISGTCYSNNAIQPNNVCFMCTSASSTSGWSLNNGAICNDGNNCTSSDTCSGGTCRGADVRDAFESNDTSGTATNLGDYADTQDFPQRTTTALTFYGSGDVDWFQYTVDDRFGGDIEPRIRVEGIPNGTNYELCGYFWCLNEDAAPSSVTCPTGTTKVSATIGGRNHIGCCRSGNASNALDIKITASNFDCPSGDDDFRTYVQVRNTSSTWSCTNSYTLQVGDD
jgi:hypothetical protein